MSSRPEIKRGAAIALDDRILRELQGAQVTRFNAFIERHFYIFAILLAVLSSVAMMHSLGGHLSGDVRLYRDVSHDLLHGKWPYRDRTLEYPPYAIPIFLLPRIAVGTRNYLGGFMALAFMVDATLKCLLIRAGRIWAYGARAVAPVALYSAAVPFLQHLYLQRFDTWPALVTVALLMIFQRRKFLTTGAILSAGVFLKLYPIVFGPALMMSALRQRKFRPFVGGLVAGVLPVALLSLELPWWRFAFFQANRGLEAESLYASVIWMGKLLGWWPATWEHVIAWTEVLGPVAAGTVPWARLLWALATLLSAGVSARLLWSHPNRSLGQMARLFLLPLLSFVIFNPVFSPQFMIWLLAVAAVATLDGALWPSLAILFCAMITPIISPSLFHDFGQGLGRFDASVMLLRNLVLVGTWFGLMSLWKAEKPRGKAKETAEFALAHEDIRTYGHRIESEGELERIEGQVETEIRSVDR